MGGIIVLGASIFFLCWWAPVHLTPILILNPEKVADENYYLADSVSSSHLEAIRDLENKGIIMTPDEYTSHISSFYSVLVAVLVGLFVVFTVLSYFITNDNSKREIANAMLDIKSGIKSEIQEELTRLMVDSIEFEEKINSAASNHVRENLAKKEYVDTLKNQLDIHNNQIETLLAYYGDIMENLSSDDEIE